MNSDISKTLLFRPASPVAVTRAESEMYSELQTAVSAASLAVKSIGTSMLYVQPNYSIHDVVKHTISQFPPHSETSVLAIDLGTVARQFFQFCRELPQVHLHYAIKCLPDPAIALMLAKLGASFDCASRHELELACDALRKVTNGSRLDDRIIFANPVKSIGDLCYADKLGISRVTFDSVDEVRKIAAHMPNARGLLRIATEDHTSAIPLSAKFGAHRDEVAEILSLAAELNVNVVGVAFHVGSGAQSTIPYYTAFTDARAVFDIAKVYGFRMHILDVGGGFPGTSDETDITFEDIAACIRQNLSNLFDPSIQVLAEPGRFMVRACATLATRILRPVSFSDDQAAYCIGDGVFGNFRNAWLYGLRFEPKPLIVRDEGQTVKKRSCLLGVSMESSDIVAKDALLPPLNRGDWLVFDNMGSYTASLRTSRKGVSMPDVVYAFSEGHIRSIP